MTQIGKHKKIVAFEKLYFENYANLCRRVFLFVWDEDITKDIVQDVFLKYWQKINELHIPESPEAYLYRACINQALNYIKEKERRENREQTFLSELSDNKANQPDMQYISSETTENIQKIIDHLPPACRNAFLLSRYEQKSYKEIASLLDISVNTVEKQIGKALKILREMLQKP
jgi:RNA polymerase sigma-70 factor (ECF subfamily)